MNPYWESEAADRDFGSFSRESSYELSQEMNRRGSRSSSLRPRSHSPTGRIFLTERRSSSSHRSVSRYTERSSSSRRSSPPSRSPVRSRSYFSRSTSSSGRNRSPARSCYSPRRSRSPSRLSSRSYDPYLERDEAPSRLPPVRSPSSFSRSTSASRLNRSPARSCYSPRRSRSPSRLSSRNYDPYPERDQVPSKSIWECAICLNTYEDRADLLRHSTMTGHSRPSYKSGRSYRNSDHSVTTGECQVQQYAPNKTPVCRICYQEFDSKKQLEEHITCSGHRWSYRKALQLSMKQKADSSNGQHFGRDDFHHEQNSTWRSNSPVASRSFDDRDHTYHSTRESFDIQQDAVNPPVFHHSDHTRSANGSTETRDLRTDLRDPRRKRPTSKPARASDLVDVYSKNDAGQGPDQRIPTKTRSTRQSPYSGQTVNCSVRDRSDSRYTWAVEDSNSSFSNRPIDTIVVSEWKTGAKDDISATSLHFRSDATSNSSPLPSTSPVSEDRESPSDDQVAVNNADSIESCSVPRNPSPFHQSRKLGSKYADRNEGSWSDSSRSTGELETVTMHKPVDCCSRCSNSFCIKQLCFNLKTGDVIAFCDRCRTRFVMRRIYRPGK